MPWTHWSRSAASITILHWFCSALDRRVVWHSSCLKSISETKDITISSGYMMFLVSYVLIPIYCKSFKDGTCRIRPPIWLSIPYICPLVHGRNDWCDSFSHCPLQMISLVVWYFLWGGHNPWIRWVKITQLFIKPSTFPQSL